MKVLGGISTTALFLLLGATVPAFAQEEHHEQEAKPEKQAQQSKPEKQAKPAKQAAQAKPEQQAKPAKEQAQSKPEQQAKPAKEQAQSKPEQQAKPAKQAAQAKPAKQEQQGKQVKQQARGNNTEKGAPQRSTAQQQKQRSEPALRLSAKGAGRIPDDRFRSNFGSGHSFRIGSPSMVDGYSRFQYGGFWFGFAEPWPEGWYYTDNVYVDYSDGEYYLCDPYYPGVRLEITVVL